MNEPHPTEQQAMEALRAKNYETATHMFFQIYERGAADNDRDLTHACVAMWMGIMRLCDSAAQACICAHTDIRDVGYASELFITCLFRLQASNPKLVSPTAGKIRETVERVAALLDYLISGKNSTYAMSWRAQILRGMGRFGDCRQFIEDALKSSGLPESVGKQLRGCHNEIEENDRDSASACQHVTRAFPEMSLVSAQKVNSLHGLATEIWNKAVPLVEQKKEAERLEKERVLRAQEEDAMRVAEAKRVEEVKHAEDAGKCKAMRIDVMCGKQKCFYKNIWNPIEIFDKVLLSLFIAITICSIAILLFFYNKTYFNYIPQISCILLLSIITLINIKTLLLPDFLTFSGALYAIALNAITGSHVYYDSLLGYFTCLVVMLILSFCSTRLNVGGGSIKMASMSCSFLGLKLSIIFVPLLYIILFLYMLSFAILGKLFGLKTKRLPTSIPISISTFVMLVFGIDIFNYINNFIK